MKSFLVVVGALTTSCALPEMFADLDQGVGGHGTGTAPLGGATTNGGSSQGGAQSGGVSSIAGGTSSGGSWSLAGSSNGGENSSSGGSATQGGASAVGGANPGGGSNSVGGSGFVGGATASGGISSQGGVTSTGGTLAVGGSTSIAGGIATGGSKPTTAGASATGGTSSTSPATGGTNPTGGTSSTGGASTGGGSGKLVAIDVSAGYHHTCAVISDGTVRCWGENCNGGIGDGRTVFQICDPRYLPIYPVKSPVQVKGISTATSVDLGAYHSCAVLEGGRVNCWGDNDVGELGNGQTATTGTPVYVYGLSNAKAVAAGAYYTCALLTDKTVKCWGANDGYQLGNGTTLANSAIPTTVVIDNKVPSTALSSVESLSAGHSHTCALTTDGSVYCWGKNGYSELGDGTTTDSNVALKCPAISAKQVAAGENDTCVLLSDDSVKCWGYGSTGALGNGQTANSTTPVAVKLPSVGASSISAGSDYACGILANATASIQCWGANDDGELGDGTSGIDRLVPVDVLDLTGVTRLNSGGYHSCAISSSGLYCWGFGSSGQIGNGTTSGATVPLPVIGF